MFSLLFFTNSNLITTEKHSLHILSADMIFRDLKRGRSGEIVEWEDEIRKKKIVATKDTTTQEFGLSCCSVSVILFKKIILKFSSFKYFFQRFPGTT